MGVARRSVHSPHHRRHRRDLQHRSTMADPSLVGGAPVSSADGDGGQAPARTVVHVESAAEPAHRSADIDNAPHLPSPASWRPAASSSAPTGARLPLAVLGAHWPIGWPSGARCGCRRARRVRGLSRGLHCCRAWVRCRVGAMGGGNKTEAQGKPGAAGKSLGGVHSRRRKLGCSSAARCHVGSLEPRGGRRPRRHPRSGQRRRRCEVRGVACGSGGGAGASRHVQASVARVAIAWSAIQRAAVEAEAEGIWRDAECAEGDPVSRLVLLLGDMSFVGACAAAGVVDYEAPQAATGQRGVAPHERLWKGGLNPVEVDDGAPSHFASASGRSRFGSTVDS